MPSVTSLSKTMFNHLCSCLGPIAFRLTCESVEDAGRLITDNASHFDLEDPEVTVCGDGHRLFATAIAAVRPSLRVGARKEGRLIDCGLRNEEQRLVKLLRGLNNVCVRVESLLVRVFSCLC